MLIALPLAGFAIAFLVLLGEGRDQARGVMAGGTFLRTAVIWGAFVTVSSEVLSALTALTMWGVALAWTGFALGWLYAGWRRTSLAAGWRRLIDLVRRTGTAERWIVGAVGLVGGVLLLIAWLSPPNNVDSLLYHMARVVHWAEDQGLQPYATARDHQLLKPIWSETAILHLRLLWGNDRPANLVQWFSLIGCVIGAATLAASLGANRTGVLLAVAFVVTIPMAILQATSTQNDLVVAFWAIATAFLVTQAAVRPPSLLDRVCLALALGVGFLTKGTFYVYAPLFVIWYFLVRWRQVGVGRMLGEGVAIAALACVLNLGFWARNVATFGGPYGTSDWLRRNLWVRLRPAVPEATPAGVATISPTPEPTGGNVAGPSQPGGSGGPAAGVASAALDLLGRVVRTGTFNLVTPVSRINDVTLSILRRAPAVFSDSYIDAWRNVAWNHEDTAANPLHFVVILAMAVLVLVMRGSPLTGTARLYALAVLGCYALIPVVIGHGPTIWGIRYQLPFFVLGAPLVAWAATRLNLRAAAPLVAAGVVVLALPWLVLNNTRPLIGHTPWPTRVPSILTTPPAEILFASNPRLLASYAQGAELIQSSGCREVGLRIDSDDLEYTFWWLLRAPQSGIHIETIYTVDRLRSLIDPRFRPCAILCTICGDRETLHGLPLAARLDRLAVFIGPGYVADPDG